MQEYMKHGENHINYQNMHDRPNKVKSVPKYTNATHGGSLVSVNMDFLISQ